MWIPEHTLSRILNVLAYVIPVIGVIAGIVLIKKPDHKKIGAIVLSVSIIAFIAFVFFVILGLG